MSDDQHAVEREKNCQNVAKHCAKMVDGRRSEVRGSYRLPKSQQKEAMTEDEQRKGRDLNRLAVANHRKNLPEEQRAVAREPYLTLLNLIEPQNPQDFKNGYLGKPSIKKPFSY